MQIRFQDLKQRQVDIALDQWRAAHLPPRPATGWIKAIREALGVPASYLAKRLGVVNSTLTRLEKSEADDTITLASLRRAAEALGCELQYALVPKQPLAETLARRAGEMARARIGTVAHTMALEAQSTSVEAAEKQVSELAEILLKGPRRELWR